MARPRLGFYGAIDERMDLDLLDGIAALQPEWQIIMIGPVAKIHPSSLPQTARDRSPLLTPPGRRRGGAHPCDQQV
jgi:hypothetical protein